MDYFYILSMYLGGITYNFSISDIHDFNVLCHNSEPSKFILTFYKIQYLDLYQ